MSRKEKLGASLKLVAGVAIPAIVIAIVTSGRLGVSQPASEAAPAAGPPITISYVVPNDLPGAPNLTQASAFAWQEFIALNWPAGKQTGQPNQRDQADPKQLFGSPSYTGPLVWQTFRAKVEIFTSAVSGGSNPPGYSPTAPSFGYDALPQYSYATAIPPYGPPAPGSTPWINLDEDDEIGVNRMYAGVSAGVGFPAPQILFGAKANRAEYTYIAGNQWFLASNLATPQKNTATYVATHKASPPPGSPTLVSLPNGTIEVKMAFRPLTAKEAASGRFYSTTVRYYRGAPPTYVDTTMGLVGLHIIQKTPSRPYFVFATFGQADNLLTAGGQPVEDVNGQPRQSPAVSPFDKNITSRNATATAPQSLSPASAGSTPRARLYVENESASLPQGNISLNKRKHPIPRAVIAVNVAAHSAIQAYNAKNAIPSSPWLYYKLVNVQYEPYDKPAGITYMGAPGGPDPATYYQANAVVESDYNLQVFSGRFNPFPLITDYTTPASPAVPFKNVLWSGKAANMGGCMGCHGNAEVGGTDFSFLIGGSGYNTAPEVAGSTAPSANTRLFTGK